MKRLTNKIYSSLILLLLSLPKFSLASNSTLDTMKKVAEDGKFAPVSEKTIFTVIADIIGAFLGILGTVFIILLVWAGYTWMTARGDEQKLEKAKNTIYRSIIGLLITAAAYAITAYIFQYALTPGSSGGAGSGPNPP